MRAFRLLVALVACLVLLVAGCGTGDGTRGVDTDAASGIGPALVDADALLAALAADGVACEPGSLEEDRARDEHTGSCQLTTGGTIYWQLDLGAATKPPETPRPGELGSGEEGPSVHEEVCEHFGGQLVLGQNWMVMGPEIDLSPVASALSAYRFVADCGGAVEALCDRDDFSGERVYVTVSSREVVLEPIRVPAGPVVICVGVAEPGRVYVAFFVADSTADLAGLGAEPSASGRDLYALPGVTSQGAIAVTLKPGSWSEQAETLEPGAMLFLAAPLKRGVPELPEGQDAPVGVLGVDAG